MNFLALYSYSENQEDAIYIVKKPLPFLGSIVLFEDKDSVIFWKQKLYLNDCRKTVVVNPENIRIFQFEDITKVVVIQSDTAMWQLITNEFVYKKLMSDIKMLTSRDKKLNEFLYDEIQLDEKGLCDIITNFAII